VESRNREFRNPEKKTVVTGRFWHSEVQDFGGPGIVAA
jgi:hypothetical protein